MMNFYTRQQAEQFGLADDRYEEAVEFHQQCIDANPTALSNYWYLGLALLLQQKEMEAQIAWLSVMTDCPSEEIDNRTAELLDFLEKAALHYYNLGKLEPTEKIYWQILELAPESLTAYQNLGNIFKQQNKLEEAIALYEEALKIEPNNAEIHNKLALFLYEQSRIWDAISYFYQATLLAPDCLLYRQRFAYCLKDVFFTEPVSENFLEEIEKCFAIKEICKQDLVIGVTSILYLDNQFQIALQAAEDKQLDSLSLETGVIPEIFSHTLFQAVLQETILFDINFERLLTWIRNNILLNWPNYIKSQVTDFNFLCSLALQCYNNEYVWRVAPEENKKLETLKSILENNLKTLDSDLSDEFQIKLIIFSMYRYLYELEGSDKLIQYKDRVNPNIRKIIKKHISDYWEEYHIKLSILPTKDSPNLVSLSVKNQYEENPYPRWFSLTQTNPNLLSNTIRFLFPHFEPPKLLESSAHILVAGCGTGKEAINAATIYKNVEVLAVDLSFTSLAYAIRMAKEMGAENIRFQQGDILDLSSLGRKFEFITSSGVLHHLDNPVEGWKILVDILQPYGLIKVGLYSEKARQEVKAARKFIQTKGWGTTPNEIRKARQEFLNLEENELARKVIESSEFYSLSGCRDLLFHVREHTFTLPQIKDILNHLKLQFIGFELSSSYWKNTYQEMFPEDPTMTNLLLWDKFEEAYPQVFSGMYILWCQKIG